MQMKGYVNRYGFSGYMTVEACYIVPLVLFIFAWLILLGFWQYDKCLAFQDDYTLATCAFSRILDQPDKNSKLKSDIGSLNRQKYMRTGSVTTQGEVSSSRIIVETSLKVNNPLSFHDGVIPEANWNIDDRVEIDNYSFTERLRIQRGIGRVIGGGD